MIYAKQTEIGYEKVLSLSTFETVDGCPVVNPTAEMLGLLPAEQIAEPINQYQCYCEETVEMIDGVVTFKTAVQYRPLEELQKEAIKKAVDDQNEELGHGLDLSLGFKIKCDADAQNRFGLWAVQMLMGVHELVVYDYDNGSHILTPAQFQVLAGELGIFVNGVYSVCTQKIESIKACETPEQLIALLEGGFNE